MSSETDLAETYKPQLVRAYLVGAYLLICPEATLSGPDVAIARGYFGDSRGEVLRAHLREIVAELESRGIELWHL